MWIASSPVVVYDHPVSVNIVGRMTWTIVTNSRWLCHFGIFLLTCLAAPRVTSGTIVEEVPFSARPPLPSKQPNILIILADDLGWGDVSFHGSGQIPTPNLDLLASSGIILNNYYVSPICSPSRSALLTGYNPIRTGMQVDVIAASTPYGLPLQYRTMGDHFADLGYRTHLVGKWHQGMFAWDYLPTRRGFHSYFGYLTGHSDYYNRTGGDNWHGYDFREGEARANISKYLDQYSTDMYTDRVVDLLEEHTQSNRTAPFLIYFAQQSVHSGTFYNKTIEPPRRYEDKFTWIEDERRRNFAGMVAALDDSVGKVFAALNQTGLLDDTIVLFSNDNGGSTGNNKGDFIDNSIGSNYPLKGSKYTLWEGGVRGTAFLWSSQLTRPYVSNQLMHIADILPTLYSAAGGQVSKLGAIDGVNQWPSLLNLSTGGAQSDATVRHHLVHNIDHTNKFWAVRYHNLKLTSGSWNAGRWDMWYEAPGQRNESADICYECTDVYKILKQRSSAPVVPVTIKVDCLSDQQAQIPCKATGQNNDNQFCLFDLETDPCEMTNLADKHPATVKKLYALYAHYNSSYAKPVNKPSDPMANPALHGGWWTPWKDDELVEIIKRPTHSNMYKEIFSQIDDKILLNLQNTKIH